MEHTLRSPSHQHGALLSLPARGTLYVLADLHGHTEDLDALFEREPRLRRNLREGSAQILFLGDLTDQKNEAPQNGDYRIGERVAELKGAHPDNVHVLASDHDVLNLWLYDSIRQLPAGEWMPAMQNKLAGRFWGQFTTYHEWFGDDTQAPALFRGAPIIATTKNGLAFVHGGVPRTNNYTLKELTQITPEEIGSAAANETTTSKAKMINPFLWGRFQPFRRRTDVWYDLTDVHRFLSVVGASLLVTGHQLLKHTNGGRRGWYAEDQIGILETSTGAGAYLKVPLHPHRRCITGSKSIRQGLELQHLR